MMYLLISLGAAMSFTIGGVFMKLSQGLSNLIPTLCVYLFFMTGATLQTLAMRKAELGVTYLFIIALEAILAFCFGIWFFKEDQSMMKLAGVGLMVAGMILLRGADS